MKNIINKYLEKKIQPIVNKKVKEEMEKVTEKTSQLEYKYSHNIHLLEVAVTDFIEKMENKYGPLVEGGKTVRYSVDNPLIKQK